MPHKHSSLQASPPLVPPSGTYAAAKTVFPRGLIQPEGSFRFSLDALLLAAFLTPQANETTLLDLGTGCGVIALRQLIHFPQLHATGIDKEHILLEAAQQNAVALNVDSRFTLHEYDIDQDHANKEKKYAIKANHFSLVTANPPYRLIGSGRKPTSALREKALFAPPQTLVHFCQTAYRALIPHGRFGVVFPANAMPRLYSALATAGFTITKILPVYAQKGKNAILVLVEAQKQSQSEQQFLPPLILYTHHNGQQTMRCEALEFCPELTCNASIRP